MNGDEVVAFGVVILASRLSGYDDNVKEIVYATDNNTYVLVHRGVSSR